MTARPSVLPALAFMVMISLTGTADANFQYVPADGATQPGSSPSGMPYNNGMALDTPPAPIARQALPAQSASSSSGMTGNDTAVINGFGKQVPLVIALREIVPTSYQFAYADGVTLGTLVNWKGGKPWPEVMNNVLSPLGLTGVEKNMVIYIDKQK